MAVIVNPLAKAEKVMTEKQAAQMIQNLDVELAMNPQISREWEHEAEQAIKLLEQRFGTRDELFGTEANPRADRPGPSSISRGAQREMSAPAGGGSSSAPARGQGRPPAAASRRAGSRTGSRRGGGRARGGWLGRAGRQTGVPAAAASTTQLVLEAIGVMFGLSLAYLLLSNAEGAGRGRSALELTVNGITGGLRAVVRPDVDPLRATAAAQAPTYTPPARKGSASAGGALSAAARSVASAAPKVFNQSAIRPR